MPLVPVKLPEIAKPRVACQAILQANTSHAVRVQAFEFSVKRAKTYDAFMSDALAAGDAAALEFESQLELSGGQDAEVLVFDLSA